MGEQDNFPKKEMSFGQQAFEHLFPGVTWDSLFPFNPASAVPLIEDMLWTGG